MGTGAAEQTRFIMNGDGVLTFETLADPPGIELIDRVERLRYRLHTSGSVSPTPVSTDELLFPVDSAVSVRTQDIAIPAGKTVCVRDANGEMITEVGHLEETTLDEGRYILEPNTQIRTYLEVVGPVEVAVDLVETRLSFPSPQAVSVGAVSWHDRPAATVTTTGDPVDMMAALGTFGSALKTTSPERSFPSNRGHPPAVELGDRVDVPESIQSPETGVRLELPPTYEAVYASAPLAYYLGADVVPGGTPRLVTDTGFEHRLDFTTDLERGVERTLKQVFLLDCITRTEGVYNIELRQRNDLEKHLDMDWARLYERPMAEQLETYLEIPYAALADSIPQWRLTVHVDPTRDTVEHLPFVVDDLAIIRSDEASTATPATTADTTAGLSRDGVLTRSVAGSVDADEKSYVSPQDDSSLEQAWIGEDIPVGASKLTTDAFRNRFDRDATTDDIAITIVLNDRRMIDESDVVNRAYGDRDNLPFDVRIDEDLAVEELRERLQQESSFLHYIGHIEADGFRCSDGKLDASTLGETGVDSFLLNACNSYDQGLELIEAGAIGGIVTLSEVINHGAVRIGESIAKLLNAGFPLRAALTIARDESVLGGQYIVVGDGGVTVTQAASRTPNLLEVAPTDGGYAVDITTYATDDAGLGTIYKPHIDGNDEYFLTSGTIASFQLSADELGTFFGLENVPVRSGNDLYWSSDVGPGDLE